MIEVEKHARAAVFRVRAHAVGVAAEHEARE
jgi:hypothetical protein